MLVHICSTNRCFTLSVVLGYTVQGLPDPFPTLTFERLKVFKHDLAHFSKDNLNLTSVGVFFSLKKYRGNSRTE